ncbi:MAG: hypothetical protein H8E44_18355 [Planctomycetes bacterium]|nr:hypothetical protein [Planctomycetota bacterium]MBL7037309.1 hypothetical protein [Pirellulaceae bacterium]
MSFGRPRRQCRALAAAVLCLFLADASSAQEHFLAKGGKAEAVIVVGRDSGPFDRWTAGELQRYLQKLSGVEFSIVTSDKIPAEKALILVGGPEDNPLVASAQQQQLVSFASLKPEGFLLKSIDLAGTPAVVAGAGDGAGTMYAAYELLERLGVVFQITGDIIPQKKPDLKLPALNVRMEPALKYRGLHYRHMWTPIIGIEEFRRILDQMAKLKYNCLEFFWYVGGPWIEYSHGDEKRQIGDVYTKSSAYLTWQCTAFDFKASDVKIGREHFRQEMVCAPEFADVQTPEQAHQAAHQLLSEIIDYAHQRKVQVWLGMGDCPSVPPNLAQHSQGTWRHSFFRCPVIPAGDPVGVEIWEDAVRSMIETYPKADGYWIWLSEGFYSSDDPDTKKVLGQYAEARKLIPRIEQIRESGYGRPGSQSQIDADIGLLHYGRELVQRTRRHHPEAKLGLALLGRAYLLRALDSLVPKDVIFQTMESSVCWNRGSRVPMEYFADVGERDALVVPRLDDDTSEFGMQFNVSLYEHDRVLAGLAQFGGDGAMPQVGKLRGLEQNAKYLAEGAWNPSLTTDAFYQGYLCRTFGSDALEEMSKAYQILEQNELAMGLDSTLGGFQGMNNFCNYADSKPIRTIEQLHANPFTRTGVPGDAAYCVRWREGLTESIKRLEQALAHLRQAQPDVLPGAQHELKYVIFKTESYISHLQSICAMLDGCVAYNAVVQSKLRGDRTEMVKQFDRFRGAFGEALDLARQTARQQAANAQEPTETYILFRYNVRFVLPIEQLCELMTTWSVPTKIPLPPVFLASTFAADPSSTLGATKPTLHWKLDQKAAQPSITDVQESSAAQHKAVGEDVELGHAGPRGSDGFPGMEADNKAIFVRRSGAVRCTALASAAGASPESYSVRCWFKSTVPFESHLVHTVLGRGNGRAFGTDTRDCIGVGGTFQETPMGKLYFYEPVSVTFVSGKTPLADGVWYDLVFVRDRSSVKVFLNGRIEIEAEAGWGGGNGDHLTFGNRVDPSGRHVYGMTGLVDEAAVWDRALDAQTVRSLFQAASKAPNAAAP